MIPLKTNPEAPFSSRHLLVLAVLAFPGMTARAELILFDNLSAGSPNGSFGVSNSHWNAQSFSTTSSCQQLSLSYWLDAVNTFVQVSGAVKTRKFLPLFLLLTVGFWCTAPSRAAIVINAVESGGDVVATLSGSINSLVGATLNQTGASAFNYNFARASDSLFSITDQSNGSTSIYNNYDIPTSPTNYGSGGNAFATSSTASTSMIFRRSAPQIWIVQDYVLGTPVTGAMTWDGTSFTTLGWTEGTYVWDWGSDSVTLNIGGSGPGPAPVPEPGTWAAAALLAGGATFLRWRRRRDEAQKEAA